MKKLCFIIPYFGTLPNYFPLFLKTCKANPDFNWLIFTDDKSQYAYPPNVRNVYMDFEECKRLVCKKFDCEVNLIKPYKLCDLKPMYGYIFSDYIKEYTYWGYCDTDMLIGNLGEILTDDFLNKYDKLFCLGHMTLFRNTPECNSLFMKNISGKEIYKDVLKNPLICWFDEEWINDYNINKIFLSKEKKVYQEDLSLNIAVAHNYFRRIKYVGIKDAPPYGFKVENEKKALYIWEEGKLYRLYKENGQLKREDFLYMHLQKRKMKMNPAVLNMKRFKIVPDEFLPLETEHIDINNFDKIQKYGHCFHTQRIFIENMKRKIKKVLSI